MENTKEGLQNTPKTPEDVMEDIRYIIYPEEELDKREAAGEDLKLQGGAYDYLEQQYGDREDWNVYEQLYQQALEVERLCNPIIIEEIIQEKQRLLDLRMELEGVEGHINIRNIPAVVEATQKEADRLMQRQNSGIAAISAFDRYSSSCLKKTDAKGSRGLAINEQHKKEQSRQNELLIQRLLESAGKNSLEYLVRGAPLMCNCGTHSRHLDMVESHGVYVNDKAVAFEDDYQADNISYFGHCHSLCCDLTETISLKMHRHVNVDGKKLTESDGAIYVDIKCVPQFEKPWQNTHEDTLIAADGKEGQSEADAGDYKRAITTASYLVCKQGGIIFPLTSGQYDESYYQAPFQDYPYEDVGSDVFFKWCEKHNICPYVPGTSEDYTWNREKIDAAMETRQDLQEKLAVLDGETGKNSVFDYDPNIIIDRQYQSQLDANKEEAKRLYEAFLNGAYEKGLDTMPDEEEDKIKAVVEEYLDSGLLSDKEKAEVANRYSGLRINYEDNG